MGGAVGALSADFFRDSEDSGLIFNFYAYVTLSHLHMPLILNSLLSQCVETDHYTNTRGSSFYHGRYQYLVLFYLKVLIIRVGWGYAQTAILVL